MVGERKKYVIVLPDFMKWMVIFYHFVFIYYRKQPILLWNVIGIRSSFIIVMPRERRADQCFHSNRLLSHVTICWYISNWTLKNWLTLSEIYVQFLYNWCFITIVYKQLTVIKINKIVKCKRLCLWMVNNTTNLMCALSSCSDVIC